MLSRLGTSIDMIVDDVMYHDGLTLQEPRRTPNKPGKPPPRVPAASAAHTDTTGAVCSSPFDWLAQKYSEKGIRNCRKKALSGNGIRPICHHEEPKHVPKDCPLLKSLNLKLIKVSPSASPPAPAPGAAASAAASPSPGGCNASTAPPPLGGSTGSATAPSGLTAWMSDVLEDFDSDEEFHWDGDKCGADYVHRKSNKSTLLYPLCCSVTVCHVPRVNPSVNPSAFPMAAPLPLPLASDNGIISLSRHLHRLIQQVLQSLIGLSLSERSTVADTGATDHMLPDKAAFISYKAISNLQVRMGNSSFIPVLGCGMAVISLNGQHVLIRNALHVPGLLVPLYSLRAHLTQRGCAFYGAYKAGMLVCFPTFILTVDTSSDCQLSYKPLGRCALLKLLHYVQPRCPPTMYPSELASPTPLSCTATHVPCPAPAVIKDDLAVSSLEVRDPSLSPPRPDHPNGAVLSSTHPPQNTMDLSAISLQLSLLAEAISHLSPVG
jgi:hypothetical protein